MQLGNLALGLPHHLDEAFGALVSSSDAGVYGLAALVFELLDRDGRLTKTGGTLWLSLSGS